MITPWLANTKTEGVTAMSAPTSGEAMNTYSKAKLLVTIFLFRVCYLSGMVVSSHFLLEHNPGDDVLRFDMRLNDVNGCFCLQGQACDNGATDYTASDCAILSNHSSNGSQRYWEFLLTPFTKWDAARFLHLATNPSMRDPPRYLLSPPSPSENPWESSEQAHAFLPMFPSILQHFSLFLYHILPEQILPPTFESLVVLSGILFNNFFCLTVATLGLYHLTFLVISRNKTLNSGGGQREQQYHDKGRHFVASVVCLVFGIWNPALVFFATNYSETFFATTSILGHLCIKLSKNQGNIAMWFIGIGCWMVGSYTRSNGSLQSLWLLQDGLSHIILLFRHRNSVCHKGGTNVATNPRTTNLSYLFRAIVIGIQSTMGAVLVTLPVRYHDLKGWDRHCVGAAVRPSWCSYGNENPSVLSSSFSLYRYIQDKHWNVGFFRYYEWKQIPNFLLAAPIITLSTIGVYQWIHWSLVTDYGKGKFPSSRGMLFVGWPLHALAESASAFDGQASSGTVAHGSRNDTTEPVFAPWSLLLENSSLLGHYAILAILAFVGLFIAHVQISTRMICSASPAITWFIANILMSPPTNDAGTSVSKYNEKEPKSGSYVDILQEKRRDIVLFYIALYLLLGSVLHVNFLPWT
ncbi:unnamed protein product [Pseudo-nitzschia multistriata]|uniref:GPI mannosyltransferase 2 n=1 Tax=Pseudo-nitzschia multistriata TaxID=183589 RepID=A0A448Z2J3_9STRA|nr:unnamed protein product [Pseudo-nitzschia multistriata]